MHLRKQPVRPLRSRAAKADGAIDRLARKLENDLKLPPGSLKLVLPSGRKARSTASIESLRNAWARKR